MVEVTKSNFEELFPSITECIKECSFIAIDSEFTGLVLNSDNEASLFDSLEKRYQKLRVRASNFLPCQIGLSMYKKSKTENKYTVDTYIFYVRPYMCGSTDRKFTCQASSLDFLCQHGFDFNKFIKEGIPYLNEEELTELQKQIEEKTVCYHHEMMKQYKDKMERDLIVTKFINSDKEDKKNSAETIEGNVNILSLDKEQGVHDYFQITQLRYLYPSLWVWSSKDKINIKTGFSKNSKEDMKKLEEMQTEEESSLTDFYLGFTRIFRCMKSTSKPIVGHNLLMDLLLFYHNFYKPLPKTYKEFKREVHLIFPVIFDTRHIWMNVKKYYKLGHISKRCGLMELFEMFKNPTDSISTLFSPAIELTNCEKYRSGEYPHESGFDSYITGWVFLRICHVLALCKIKNPVLIQPQTLKQYLLAVGPFMNKINLSFSNVRYMDLVNEDPIPVESQVLHLSVKNKDTTLNHVELNRLFDKYGMFEFKIMGREAIVAIGNLRSYREILKDFKNEPNFVVTKYSYLKHSPLVSNTIWLTTIGVCTISAFYIIKFYL